MFLIGCQKGPDMITASLTSRYLTSSLDPSYIQFTHEFFLLENLTSRLVRLDENGSYQLDLASDIERTSPTIFRIKIKDSHFSNGEKISVEDVKNTLQRNIRLGASHANLKEFIDSVHVDGDVLVVTLRKKTNSFFYYLSLPDLGILHKSQLKERLTAADFTTISSGPFIYRARSKEDFSLVKNPHYKLSNVSYPEEVQLIDSYTKDELKECAEGKLAIGTVAAKRIDEAKRLTSKKTNLKLLGHTSDNLTYLIFNKHSSIFKKPQHRAWLRNIIDSHFRVPETYAGIATRSRQYFHNLSKAHIPESEIDVLLDKKMEKPIDFPEKIKIKVSQSQLDITLETLVRTLEHIPGIRIEIDTDLDLGNILNVMKQGTDDIFLYVMSTDYRVPVEAVNIEYFSNVSSFVDVTGKIKSHFIAYQGSTNDETATGHLKEISKQMILDAQHIPLFHSVSPFIVNSDLVDIGDVNHLFIYNFWKFKAR